MCSSVILASVSQANYCLNFRSQWWGKKNNPHFKGLKSRKRKRITFLKLTEEINETKTFHYKTTLEYSIRNKNIVHLRSNMKHKQVTQITGIERLYLCMKRKNSLLVQNHLMISPKRYHKRKSNPLEQHQGTEFNPWRNPKLSR